MTGVLEWRSESVGAAYPLAASIADNDLLLDAQFVCFDNFVPTLKSYTVTTDRVKLTVSLEDGDCVVELSNAVPAGSTVPINLTRYRGCLVVGPGVARLLATEVGKTVPARTKFLATTVTSVSSAGGVFSFGAMTGVVNVNPDEHMTVVPTTGVLTFNAVALPSKKATVTLLQEDNYIYGVTSTRKLVKVDVTTGTTAAVTQLDRVYTCVTATPAGKLYAVAGQKLYELNQVPAKFVMNLTQGVNGIHCSDAGVVYVAGTGVAIIDPVAKTETSLFTMPAGTICTGDLTQGSSATKLYMTLAGTHQSNPVQPVGGPEPGQTLQYTPDKLAEFNLSNNQLTVVGNVTATIPGSVKTQMVGVYALTNTPSKLFGWCYFLDPNADPDPVEWNVALNISTKLATASVVHLNAYDPLMGFLYGTTKGRNAQIVVNNFQALKTLNGQEAQSNALIIEDSALLKLENTGPGELTVGLPEITTLQISRAKKYSNEV